MLAVATGLPHASLVSPASPGSAWCSSRPARFAPYSYKLGCGADRPSVAGAPWYAVSACTAGISTPCPGGPTPAAEQRHHRHAISRAHSASPCCRLWLSASNWASAPTAHAATSTRRPVPTLAGCPPGEPGALAWLICPRPSSRAPWPPAIVFPLTWHSPRRTHRVPSFS
jgi:hypothetical protein